VIVVLIALVSGFVAGSLVTMLVLLIVALSSDEPLDIRSDKPPYEHREPPGIGFPTESDSMLSGKNRYVTPAKPVTYH
jgi:hypothetical protein